MKYKIGSGDPAVYRDIGSGAWKSEPATLQAQAQRLFILANIGNAALAVGRHAASHLNHYFHNSGSTFQADLRGMLNDVASAKDVFDAEVKEAVKFAESLSPGQHQITSTKCSAGYNMPNESKDWYYAVGAYQSWGKATVTVPAAGAKPGTFGIDFEYSLFDQYNWNGGGSVTLFGKQITDEDLGRFHKMGIAKEFDVRASIQVSFEWTAGSSPVVPVPTNLQISGIGKAIGA